MQSPLRSSNETGYGHRLVGSTVHMRRDIHEAIEEIFASFKDVHVEAALRSEFSARPKLRATLERVTCEITTLLRHAKTVPSNPLYEAAFDLLETLEADAADWAVRAYLTRFFEVELNELQAGSCPMYGLLDPVIVTGRVQSLLSRFAEHENTATTP